jgi:hypothetical protein
MKEALKLALESLEWMVANDDTNEGDEPVERLGGQSWNEYNAYWLDGLNKARASITAIKQALAAPVQEPVPDWDAWNLISRLNRALESIGDYAHDKSTGPAVPDALWEIRSMAYDAIEDATQPAAQPAVPDAFGTREGEHPQYVQGFNDCRAEMLKGMK